MSADRQKWEDRINEGFAHVRSSERVCFHADCTTSVKGGWLTIECDYCPASAFGRSAPPVPAPWYFKDPDPLFLPVRS